MTKIKIANKTIGNDHPVFIIAEAGSNHNGKIEYAKRLIDASAEAGADAVKFQSFKAEKLFNEFSRPGTVSKLKDAEFKEEWYDELFKYAGKKGLIFLSTPFDEDAADALEKYGMEAYKIASYELTHIPLIEHVAKKKKPVILSTGMAEESEISDAVNAVYKNGNKQLALLYCISQYPTRIDNINLGAINALNKKFNCIAGFSDHTTSIYTPIGAASFGAKIIEKHITFDKHLDLPDNATALDPAEFKNMILGIREIEKMRGKETISYHKNETEEREWRRAVYAKQNIANDTLISENMLMIVRPSPKGSLAPKYFRQIIGKKTKKALKQGDCLTKDHVDLI